MMAIPVLDWEQPGTTGQVSWAKALLDEVYRLSGVRPLIYMSASVVNGNNWSSISGYYGAQEVALTVKSGFRPAKIWNSYCAMSGSEWGSDYVGYAYTSTNGKIWLNCMPNASCNVAKIRFFWVKA